ncbi:MAG: cupin domain-containing protein [bacterium]
MLDDEFLQLAMGAKIQRLREEQGRTLQDLANATGLSESRLHAYETSIAEPAIGELLKIASALDVSISRFFQTENEVERRVEVVRASERWAVQPRTEAGESLNYRYQALSHRLTEKRMEPFLIEVPPGAGGALPQSAHDGEEFLFVLAGRLEVEVGGEVHRLSAGDSIYYDSRLKHSLRAIEGGSARLIACVAQARRATPDNPLGRAFRE